MDIQKIAYDLSLIYTKAKYEQSLLKGTIPIAYNHPQYLEDSVFLTKTFTTMYFEIISTPGLLAELEEMEP